MSQTWSKLERRLREFVEPSLNLRFRFTAYRYKVIQTPWEGDLCTKLWLTQGKRTIWSVPQDRHAKNSAGVDYYGRRSPGWVVELAAEYLQLPRAALVEWRPDWMGWGMVDILKAVDKRIGKRRWEALRQQLEEPTALYLLDQRRGKNPPPPPLGGRRIDQLHDAS